MNPTTHKQLFKLRCIALLGIGIISILVMGTVLQSCSFEIVPASPQGANDSLKKPPISLSAKIGLGFSYVVIGTLAGGSVVLAIGSFLASIRSLFGVFSIRTNWLWLVLLLLIGIAHLEVARGCLYVCGSLGDATMNAVQSFIVLGAVIGLFPGVGMSIGLWEETNSRHNPGFRAVFRFLIGVLVWIFLANGFLSTFFFLSQREGIVENLLLFALGILLYIPAGYFVLPVVCIFIWGFWMPAILNFLLVPLAIFFRPRETFPRTENQDSIDSSNDSYDDTDVDDGPVTSVLDEFAREDE